MSQFIGLIFVLITGQLHRFSWVTVEELLLVGDIIINIVTSPKPFLLLELYMVKCNELCVGCTCTCTSLLCVLLIN